MKNKNEILDLSFDFALDIIDIHKHLSVRNERIMSKQLLRCGTSIGANVNEAQAAQTKKDFIAKMSIASKEARETLYWIRLLFQSGYLNNYDGIATLKEKTCSIVKLLTKIVKSSQEK